jgi:hypothetical protein
MLLQENFRAWAGFCRRCRVAAGWLSAKDAAWLFLTRNPTTSTPAAIVEPFPCPLVACQGSTERSLAAGRHCIVRVLEALQL